MSRQPLPWIPLVPGAKGPRKALPGDLGYDLFAIKDYEVGPLDSTMIDTGIALAIPDGYGGLLMGRSGLGKKAVTPLGFVIIENDGTIRLGGAIDSGYRGEVKVMLASLRRPQTIKAGDAVAQIWILPVDNLEPEDYTSRGGLPASERLTRGFGSTDDVNRGSQGFLEAFGEIDRQITSKLTEATASNLDPCTREQMEVASRRIKAGSVLRGPSPLSPYLGPWLRAKAQDKYEASIKAAVDDIGRKIVASPFVNMPHLSSIVPLTEGGVADCGPGSDAEKGSEPASEGLSGIGLVESPSETKESRGGPLTASEDDVFPTITSRSAEIKPEDVRFDPREPEPAFGNPYSPYGYPFVSPWGEDHRDPAERIMEAIRLGSEDAARLIKQARRQLNVLPDADYIKALSLIIEAGMRQRITNRSGDATRH